MVIPLSLPFSLLCLFLSLHVLHRVTPFLLINVWPLTEGGCKQFTSTKTLPSWLRRSTLPIERYATIVHWLKYEPFFLKSVFKFHTEMLIVSIGQRGSGDESPGRKEDGPEGEGKEGGEAERAGPNGSRPQGRDQESRG